MPTLFGQSYRKTGTDSNPIYFRDDQSSGTSSTLSSSEAFFGELSWWQGDGLPTDGVQELNFTFAQDNINDTLSTWAAQIHIWTTSLTLSKPYNSDNASLPGSWTRIENFYSPNYLTFNLSSVSPVSRIYSRKIDGGTTSFVDIQVDATNKHELKLKFIGGPIQQAFWKNPVNVVVTSSYKG